MGESMRSRVGKIIGPVAAAMLLACMLALAGCGTGNHQVVSDVSACGTCHAPGFTADTSAQFRTSGAYYSATGKVELTIKGAERVYLCTAVGSNQGSNKEPVPILLKGPIPVIQGEAIPFELEPGSYLFVIQERKKVSSRLLIVDPTTTQKTTEAFTLGF